MNLPPSSTIYCLEMQKKNTEKEGKAQNNKASSAKNFKFNLSKIFLWIEPDQ